MRSPKEYGKRKTAGLEKREPKRRYFLAFEGETESQYFKGLRNYAEELGISDNIEIFPVSRHYAKKDCSHPSHVCASIMEYIKEHSTEERTAVQIIELFNDWIKVKKHVPNSLNTAVLLHESFQRAGISDEDTNIPVPKLEACLCEVLEKIPRQPPTEELIREFTEHLKKECSFKVKYGDFAGIVIDRDSGDFFEWQYDDILQKTAENDVNMYVTNPRFEFWLLLHFLSRNEMNMEKILQVKTKGEEPFLEHELHCYLPSISKASVPFEELKDKVDAAILHEKDFCEDVIGLKSNVGSNIGILISEMKKER